MSAAGAMLSKVWCSEYSRRSTLGSPHDQALRRQWHYNGLFKFRYQDVLDFLPILLYSSIMMFMVGLCDYLYGLHKKIAIYVITTFSCSFVFAASLTFLSLVLPEYFPYRVPLAGVIIRVSSIALKHLLLGTSKLRRWFQTSCFASQWLLVLHWNSLGQGLAHMPFHILASCRQFWQLARAAVQRLPQGVSMLPQTTQAFIGRLFVYHDAFGSVVAARPIDDGYSSLEVEALAWLVKSSPVENVVNDLLKDIPTIVSTFKRRRKFFIKNGAVGRLCTLFVSSFDKDCEGPCPGITISKTLQKRDNMMIYGFSIYALCNPQTFPAILKSEIACLQDDVKLSHRILGLALETCQNPIFHIDKDILSSLVSNAISESQSQISEEELEMLLGIVLRAVKTAPHPYKLASSQACDALCGLMNTNPVTARTAALFCQAVHHLIFQKEMEEPLHDYNPAWCTYYLSYQCVPQLHKIPVRDAQEYSYIFMCIIQCLCNNEAQLNLHDRAQTEFASFVCGVIIQPGIAYRTIKEGLITLLALSKKDHWEHQNYSMILDSCHKVATQPNSTLELQKMTLLVVHSIAALMHDGLYQSNTVQATISFLEQEISSGAAALAVNHEVSIYHQVSRTIHNEIMGTFICAAVLENSPQTDANSYHREVFRYSRFPSAPTHMLQSCTALINMGLADIKVSDLLGYLSGLPRHSDHALSVIHLFTLLPSVIPWVLSERDTVKKMVAFAGSSDISINARKYAASIVLAMWHRVVDTSSWTKEEQRQWIMECILSSGFIHTMKDLFESYLQGVQYHSLWEVHNWIVRLEELAQVYPMELSRTNILGTIKVVLDNIHDTEREMVWKDKLAPTTQNVHHSELKERVEYLENLVGFESL